MFGLGTLINTATVILGGLIGMCLKNGLKKNVQDILMQTCGVATIFIGASGTLAKMFVIENNNVSVKGTMLLIISLVIGGMLGEVMHIEDTMDSLGERIKKTVKAEKDNLFVEGFVNVSLITCVGAMAIVGSIQDGISGDYSLLMTKSILDLVIVVVFSSTYGVGAVFSAVPIFVYQGSITLMAAIGGSFLSDAIISDLSFVGNALIFCVGVNIAFGKKFRVGNMLPALIVPVIYNCLTFLQI